MYNQIYALTISKHERGYKERLFGGGRESVDYSREGLKWNTVHVNLSFIFSKPDHICLCGSTSAMGDTTCICYIFY